MILVTVTVCCCTEDKFLVGTSTESWEAAAVDAIEHGGKSLRDLRIAEVDKLDRKIEDGKVVGYRARVRISFKFRD